MKSGELAKRSGLATPGFVSSKGFSVEIVFLTALPILEIGIGSKISQATTELAP